VLWSPGPFEFRECPARFVDPVDEAVLVLHRGGFFASLAPAERLHQPAALVEALVFLDTMDGEVSDG
jgi:hypothetical protein